MKAEFLEQMQQILKEEYPLYLEEIEKPARRGFRVNTLKISVEEFFERFPVERIDSPFAENGFYNVEMDGKLRTLLNAAGLIYMQEPSASSSVTMFHPEPNWTILDLCAAPGSKTTQIAERMSGNGFLVANEIDTKRSGILVENVERHGITNCLVLNDDPRNLEKTFEAYFDAILCDAPCSGEGMFRKEDQAIENWSRENVLGCALKQSHILESVYKLLKPGGVIQYSTCTFNFEENENMVKAFVAKHPDLQIEEPEYKPGRSAFDLGEGTDKARRVFPMDGGEGHFLCRIRKEGTLRETDHATLKSQPIPSFAKSAIEEIWQIPYPYLYMKNERIYGGDHPFVDPKGCRIRRHQVLLGEVKKNRFEPDYASAMAANHPYRLRADVDDETALKYLHGESFSYKGKKGYYQICWQGFEIGLGKCDGAVMKNHLPKNYRIR